MLAIGQPWLWTVSEFIFLALAYEGGWLTKFNLKTQWHDFRQISEKSAKLVEKYANLSSLKNQHQTKLIATWLQLYTQVIKSIFAYKINFCLKNLDFITLVIQSVT